MREVFVGRSAELEELTALATAAASGRGAVVLITGEAGAGKSALVAQLAARVALPVRSSQCWEDEGQPPYWPWTQLLRAHLPEQPRHPSPLGVLLPELPPAAGTDRFALHEAVVAALDAGGPALLVIEDAHLADAPSIALLLHLARRVGTLGLLVVVTCRDTDVMGSPLGEVLGSLVRLATTQSLTGLGAEDVDALLLAVVGHADAAMTQEIHTQSGGNALFATELARLLAHRGDLGAVPIGLAAVVQERVAGFDLRTVEALEAAAVLGLTCSVHELAAVLGRDVPAVLDLLAAPRTARVLRDTPAVTFSHALVRAVLLQGLPPAKRMELHARCVQALEPVPDRERLGRLAAHAVEAVPLLGSGPAVTWSRGAARVAMSGMGYQEAARHLTTVVRLVDEPLRAEALLELAKAHHLAGDTGQALEALGRALPLAREQGDLLVDVALAVAASTPLFAPAPELVALLEEAQARAPLGTPRGDAVASQRWVRLLTHGARDEEAERWAAQRVEAAGDDAASALAFQHLVLHRCDRVHERLEVASREAALADRSGDPDVGADAGLHLLLAGLELADRARADEGLRRLEAAAASSPRPLRLLYVLTRRAMLAVLDGRYGEAQEHLDAAEELAGQADLPEFVPGIAVLRVCLAHESAMTAPSEPVALLAALSQRIPLMFSAGLLAAREQRAQGQHEAAAALLARALDTRPRRPEDQLLNGLGGLVLLAEVVAELGPTDLAAELLSVLSPYADRAAVVALAVVCLGPVARSLGLLAASLGRDEEADRWFEQGLQVAERLRSAPWVAQVQVDWAKSLEVRDPARAASLREQAAATASRLGMPRLLTVPAIALVRQGDQWSVTHEGVTARVRDSKGLRYLADLLAHPGVERRALDLIALVEGPGSERHELGDSGPQLDAQAKAAYRARILELRSQLDAADGQGDAVRSEQVQTELDALAAELSRAVGLGGRDRLAGSAAEKARLNVTRALRSAIARLADTHPSLAAHLDQTVRTGLLCCYDPVHSGVNGEVNASMAEAPASTT